MPEPRLPLVPKVFVALVLTTPLGLGTGPVMAMGGHYVVDDAATAAPGRCEAYAWYSRGGSDDQAVEAELACNPLGNLELTVGLGRFKDGDSWETGAALEAKHIVRQAAVGGWGWGVVGRSEWRDTFGDHANAQLYLPVTVIVNDRVALHVNGGGVWERDDRNAATWGVAADVNLTPQLNLIGESYGTHRGDTEFQIGLRSRFGGGGQADLSYGWARSNSSDNWITLGLAWML